MNDPGRQTWETFSTGTLAALKGGITTLVDMPLNSIPPTTTIDNLHTKIQSAKGNLFVDTGFYGGVIPGNSEHLSALIEGGVRGFKCFMIESGVEEFPMCEESDIRLAMEKLRPFSSKTFLMFHAELAPCCDSSGQDKRLYETFLQTRPRSMENSAIDLVIKLCEEFQSVPCHIVHLSSADAIDSIKRAKSKGLPLTVETCFHYLALDAEQVPKGIILYT